MDTEKLTTMSRDAVSTALRLALTNGNPSAEPVHLLHALLLTPDNAFAPERALLTAPLESRMHISRAKCTSRRAQDRSTPPPRTAPARATPTHGPRLPVRKAQWDYSVGVWLHFRESIL